LSPALQSFDDSNVFNSSNTTSGLAAKVRPQARAGCHSEDVAVTDKSTNYSEQLPHRLYNWLDGQTVFE
jgi:hypothetical protein